MTGDLLVAQWDDYVSRIDLNDAGKICGWRDYFDNRMWFDNGGPTLHLD